MKLRLHHIELCVKDPSPVVDLLCNQFGLHLVGHRESKSCVQFLLKLSKTVFLVTARKGLVYSQNKSSCDKIIGDGDEDELPKDSSEAWTLFCCDKDEGHSHTDSVFNVAVEVKDLGASLKSIRESGAKILQEIKRVESNDGPVDFAVVKSCCGNVVHTLIQKDKYSGWFLPGFSRIRSGRSRSISSDGINCGDSHIKGISMTHFDHFTLACRVGETNEIIEWYERTFGMKRFLTNRQDSDEDGLVIGDDVGLRLKVLEFWKCSEAGLASQTCEDEEWEPLKIVIAESLPNISNTQIESFINDHGCAGIQHLGLHTESIVETVHHLTEQGVRFRHPPPTYYTEVGQLKVIESVGENAALLGKYGILLDNEADVFEPDYNPTDERYLMQVFTHPIFDKDTFFLEVIQRRGARGFGVGNVTALARSVNAYKAMLQKEETKEKQILMDVGEFVLPQTEVEQ